MLTFCSHPKLIDDAIARNPTSASDLRSCMTAPSETVPLSQCASRRNNLRHPSQPTRRFRTGTIDGGFNLSNLHPPIFGLFRRARPLVAPAEVLGWLTRNIFRVSRARAAAAVTTRGHPGYHKQAAPVLCGST